MNLPTGEYDRNKDINPGNNAVSLDPYWAATYWLNPKWTASTRIHYLYNFKNNEPGYAFGAADDIQAGQAIHANFATDYAVTPQLRLGINGYWLKQVTDTEVDGEKVKGRREQVWAIGPGQCIVFPKMIIWLPMLISNKTRKPSRRYTRFIPLHPSFLKSLSAVLVTYLISVK